MSQVFTGSSTNSANPTTSDKSELQLQRDCFLWAYNTLPETRRLLWHVTNEMKPHPGETKKAFAVRIAQAKAAGLVPGVADLHFFWNCQLYVFELKVDRNTLSDDQKKFRDAIIGQGGEFFEVRDLETFQQIFKSIITSC